MPLPTQSAPPRLIVIPHELEGFFFERLTQQFAGRDDLKVIVARGTDERRAPRRFAGAEPLSGQHRSDRPAAWSLPDMPFSAA